MTKEEEINGILKAWSEENQRNRDYQRNLEHRLCQAQCIISVLTDEIKRLKENKNEKAKV